MWVLGEGLYKYRRLGEIGVYQDGMLSIKLCKGAVKGRYFYRQNGCKGVKVIFLLAATNESVHIDRSRFVARFIVSIKNIAESPKYSFYFSFD